METGDGRLDRDWQKCSRPTLDYFAMIFGFVWNRFDMICRRFWRHFFYHYARNCWFLAEIAVCRRLPVACRWSEAVFYDAMTFRSFHLLAPPKHIVCLQLIEIANIVQGLSLL